MKNTYRTVCFLRSGRNIPIKFHLRHRSLKAYLAFKHAGVCRFANEHNIVIGYGYETIFPKYWNDVQINDYLINNLPF